MAQLNMKILTKTKQAIADHVRKQAVARGEHVSTTKWMLEAAAEKMKREGAKDD